MKKYFLYLPVACLALTACDKTKEQFDFSKKAPDEFAVVKRAPLEMPPDYHLRPPSPGAPRPQELQPVEQAKVVVLGEDTAQQQKPKEITAGESILLQKAGASTSIPNIRQLVDKETAALAKEETPTIDRLLKVTGKKVEAPAKTVDAKAETERLKENYEEGKPVTEGETPVKE